MKIKKIILLLTSGIIVSNLYAEQVKIAKEIKVYQVPLETYLTNSVKQIEQLGVLEKKQIVKNNQDAIIVEDKNNQAIIIFNKKIPNKEKIKLLLKSLKKQVNKSDINNRQQILKLIQIINTLIQ